MKIALIGIYPPPFGGGSIHIQRLSNLLEENNIAYTIYDLSGVDKKEKNVIEIEDYVVAISLIIMIPFLFQRPTIWETPLFALLYFPSLLKRELE